MVDVQLSANSDATVSSWETFTGEYNQADAKRNTSIDWFSHSGLLASCL